MNMWIGYEYSFARVQPSVKASTSNWEWKAMIEGVIWGDSILDLANKQQNFRVWMTCVMFEDKVDRNGSGAYDFKDLVDIMIGCEDY